MKIVFNHFYRLHHDAKRSYIFGGNNNNKCIVVVKTNWISKIHPVYAMVFAILSNPIELDDAVDELSDFLETDKSISREIILNRTYFHSNAIK